MFDYRPQGKVMFSQVSVHNRPRGYSVTAHSCYGAVGTHPTGMLSCVFVVVYLWKFWQSIRLGPNSWEDNHPHWPIQGGCMPHPLSQPFFQFHAVFEENGQNNNRFTPTTFRDNSILLDIMSLAPFPCPFPRFRIRHWKMKNNTLFPA